MRQLGAYFFLFCNAPNHPELVGDERRIEKKICEIKFGNYRRSKFGPHCLLAQDASLRQYIGAAQVYPSLIFQQISYSLWRQQFAAFCLFVRTLPIEFALLGRKTEIHKIKDDSKINREKNIDRRVQRHIVNVWHPPDPPSFSLPTTFKDMPR